MEEQKPKGSGMEKIATFIVDKRNLFFLLYAFALIFSIVATGWVKVENDITTYLPEDTETRQGLTVMNDNFVTYGTARVMVSNVTYETAENICSDLESIDGVTSVDFDDTTDHYKSASALFSVTFDGTTTDDISIHALHTIRDMLAGYDTYIDTEVGVDTSADLQSEMSVILVLAAIVIVLVLTLTSRSYAEVPVLIMTFGAAALLNMGTNFLCGTISFISNSVTVILQLALAIDYAIILCHRFSDEHETKDTREACIAALSKAIPEISSSSLTTISGLGALAFMHFGIGRDMATVLIKAILFSLLSVFTLMPGLLMVFSKKIDATRHKNLIPKITFLGKFDVATRFIVPPIFAVVVVVTAVLANKCPYCYSYTDLVTAKQSESQIAHQKIKNTFGVNNMVAVIVPTGDYDSERQLLKDLDSCAEVKSTQGLANIDAMDGYKLADALTPAHIEKTAVLSIHPCDFLEMSNRDNTWSSCHCLERGSYHGGCQSYMGDAVSMIFFTVSDEYTQDFHTAPRITREIFCYKDNVLLQSRLYPTDLEDQKTLYRGIVQQAIATCLDKPNLWSIKRGKDTEPYCESAADSNHYPDYEYGYAVVSLLKGETDYGKMTIGSVARCVCCGGEQKDHRSIRCAECGSMFVCKGCGKTVHGYGRYIDNHFYCKECSYRCTACGEEFIGMPRIGITRSGEQRGICPACYEQVISVCRNCAIHKRLPSHRCQSLPEPVERPCRIKEESMQELTFETILRLPQMELKKTLKAELKSRGYPITDKPGYLYAEGTIPVLLVAHMDTVHRQPVEQICYSADGAVAMSPQGIGGDDRCGVWMILQILRTTNCHVLFCEDEEVGCIGAKKFTGGSLRPQVNYIVELDRRGNNDAVFYRCDNPEFEDFVTSFGFETAGGSCSDISYIAPYLETAAVNISCGYYCEHQRHEYIHLEEIELNADRVAQMVTQQTEHFEYMEQQDSFFGGRAYQYSMWDTASERDTYKWLSPLPKEAKIKLGTAELILPHAKIDRQGKVHRYVPKLKAAVLTENAIAVMPDGKKARYDFQKAKCQKVMPLSRALEILNTI